MVPNIKQLFGLAFTFLPFKALEITKANLQVGLVGRSNELPWQQQIADTIIR